MTFDEEMMALALDEARAAFECGEAPIGAVLVQNGKVIARGRNTRETEKNALGHAEINAIAQGCKALSGWRLMGCTLYVTLEPCPMCAGAIINSRIERVVYGARDDKAGSMGSLIDLTKVDYNHHPRLTCGVLEEECAALMSEFFRSLRNRRSKKHE